jgi:hypothetical protein
MKNKKTRRIVLVAGISILILGLFFFVVGPRLVEASTGCFTDTNGHVFETYICWLFDNGISVGYGDGTYGPNDNITRGQMAVFLQRVHELSRWGQTWTGTGDGLILEGTFPSLVLNSTMAGSEQANLYYKADGNYRYLVAIDPYGGDDKDFYIYDSTNSAFRLYMAENGNTGVNTLNPIGSFHVIRQDAGLTPDTTQIGVYGEGPNGVRGESATGSGVVGISGSWYGGWFEAGGSGTGGRFASEDGALILGYDLDPGNTRFRVTNIGNVQADGSYTSPADFAELMDASEDASSYESGDVLVIMKDGTIGLSQSAFDTTLAGVYSENPGFLGDEQISQYGLDVAEEMSDEGRIKVAILGIVPVKVTDEGGAIEPGDMLTTSNTPGHAMKCNEPIACFGAVLGKALEGLEGGNGIIRVLVTLR